MIYIKIKAFLLGMYEFRTALASNPGERLIPTYDRGREFAHWITFRHFEQ